jgi:hypothetical protein
LKSTTGLTVKLRGRGDAPSGAYLIDVSSATTLLGIERRRVTNIAEQRPAQTTRTYAKLVIESL